MTNRKPWKRFRHQTPLVNRRDRIYEQLEERILFDAVPDGSLDVLEGLTDDPFAPMVATNHDAFAINAATAAELSPETQANEIVFVDKSVDNYDQLVVELVDGKDVDIVFLNQSTDGLLQIADALADRTGIAAIHLISHGQAAELHLGSTVLTAESIRSGDHASALTTVRGALTETADLLVYGCNFGAGAAGADAATALADATGADVAASQNDTGTTERGADWQLERVIGEIETQIMQATAWDGLLAPTLRLDLGNVQPTEVDLTGTGDGSLGLQATWVNAGYVGAQRIDLRATIVSQDTTLTHDLFTRSFAGSYFPSIASVGQDWVQLQWDIFDTGTTDSVTADIIVGLNDLDGPNNEAIRFNVCDPVVEHIMLSSNTQMGHAFDSGTGDVTLDGQANYGGIDERISVQVAYHDQTSFAMSRTANNGFFLSFDFNETLTYSDPLQFDCSNFLLPVSADDFAIAAGGAPVSVAIMNNDSSNNTGAADTVELVVPAGATNLVLDNDFDDVGFDVAGEGTWFFDESTLLLTFTPEIGFTADPTPVQYTFENIDGIGSNTSTVTIDLQYAAPVIDLDAASAGSGYSTSFTEGTAAIVVVNSDFSVVDGDSTAMQSITMTPSGIVNGASEILTFHGDGATSVSFGMDGLARATEQITVNGVMLDVTYDGTGFTVTRNGGGTIANTDIATLLAATTYENSTASAIPGDRTLSISASDGAFDSNIATSRITVIPDYLSVASPLITINEDQSTTLGVTVDPDLYLGGPLQDVIGTSTGFRVSGAGATSTDFTIPDNVTGIVITGYSTEPDDTAASDTFNDDYQVLSAYVDVARGISNGTLTRHIDLSTGGSRDADQFSWLAAELGTAVQDGSATLSGETAGGTNPTFTIVGNTLQIVENHGLETAYHVEFMTSNRQSTNFVGALSGAQVPGTTSSTLSIPAGTNYLILNENAAAPGADFRFEYKGFSRVYIDLDTMTASGTIAAEIGENADRTVTYAFENYDISSSTAGGVLASGATIVGDTTAQASVANSPNIYINGFGDLVIERTAAFATDFTSMYTLETYERTGYSSIATIVDANADDSFFDATLNGGVVNTLSYDVPASARVGVFRLSMGTPGGTGDNENMGTGFAIIDLENGTSSGSFMNIRTTTPDLLSWSDVALTDDPGTGSVDERVFFTAAGTVSNRSLLSEFTDGWGGTAYFDLVTNPDGTRTVTFNAVSDVGDNAYQDYQTHGQFTWLGNEPFRIRTTGAGGTFSHGAPILDGGGNPTGDWEIDVLDLPSVTYTPDPHYSGSGYLEVELLSTGEYERIDINVLPIADTPTMTLTDPTAVNKGQTSDLSSAIAAALVDTDGSETITLIEFSSISDGFTVDDGTNSFTSGGGTSSVDITAWNLNSLTMDSPPDYAGTESVTVRVQTTDNRTINATPYTDVTEPTDGPGEQEANGTLNVRWQNVIAALDLDASNDTATAADYADTFTEGGNPVAIADMDTTLVDPDDTAMAAVTITPGAGEFPDGTAEILTLHGDAATAVSFGIDGAAAATQQIVINGTALDAAYDGTAFVITKNGGGEILQADAVALLESATYHNSDPAPATTDRTFAIKVNDGSDDSNIATSTISVVRAAVSAAWSLSGPGSIDEGGTAAFDIDLSSNLLQAGETASVVLTLTDSSTVTSDYGDFLAAISTAVSTRSDVTFDAGTRTLTYTSTGTDMSTLSIPLAIVNDDTIEGPESFTVGLSGPSSSTGETITVSGIAGSVTTAINDTQGAAGAADGPGNWSLSGPASADEGSTADYTLSLSETFGAGEAASVRIHLNDLSTNSSDYATALTAFANAATASPDVTFDGTDTFTFTSPADSQSMPNLTISLGINDDALIEGAESYSLEISSPSSATGANVGLTSGSTTVSTTIGDTQGAGGSADGPAEWSVVGPSASVSEGSAGNFSISLSGLFGNGESAAVTLGLTENSTSSGDHGAVLDAVQTAITAGARSELTLSGSVLTFTSSSDGDSMADLSFSMTATDDNTVEETEDFDVTLTSPGSTTGAAVATGLSTANMSISDDSDTAEVTIAAGIDGNETGPVNGTFTVGMTNPSSTDTVINYTVSGTANSGDHTLTSGTVTIAAGDTSAMITVPVTDDSLIEGTESVAVTLTSINSGDAQISVGAADSASIDIIDSEGAGEWALNGPTSVDEGDTSGYTLSLSGAFEAGETATVQIQHSDISTNSSDYTAMLTAIGNAAATNPSVTFDGTDTLTYTADSDGASMADLFISPGMINDTLIEGPELFSLAISNAGSATGATIGLASGFTSVTTIVNDTQGAGGAPDGPAAWSVFGPISVDEGDMASFLIRLSGVLQNGEDTSVVLNLTAIDTDSSDYGDLAAAVTAAVAARTDLSFNAGTGTLTYTGTGTAMSDLAVSLSVTDDSIVEGSEQFSVGLSSAVSTSGISTIVDPVNNSVTATINDTQGIGGAPDQTDWSIIGDASMDEGGTATFTVSMDQLLQTGENAAIHIDLADIETSSGDYADFLNRIQSAVASRTDLTFDSGTGRLTYTGTGSLMADLVVSMDAVDDSLAEGPERFQILLSNPGSTSGAVIGVDPAANNATTTIRDTVGDGGALEEVVWSFGFDQTVPEGDNTIYVLSLNGAMAVGESVSADIGLADLDTTSADYEDINTAIASAVATYNASPVPGSLIWNGTTITFNSDGTGPMADLVISLGTVNDIFAEGVEDIRVGLSNAVSATGVAVSINAVNDGGVTTIDDTAGPGADEAIWSATGATVIDEGGTLQYTLSLSGTLQAAENAFVELAIGNITTNSADYGSIVTAVQTAIALRPELSFDAATGVLTYIGNGTPMSDLLIDLMVTDDSLTEGPEQFDLTLSAAGSDTGALIGIDAIANNVTTTINDTVGNGGITEPGGAWSITGSASINEGNTAAYAIAVTGDLQAGEDSTVQLSFTDLETNSSDYSVFMTAVQNAVTAYTGPGSVSFDAGIGVLTFVSAGTGSMTDLNLSFGSTEDVLVEGAERFRIDLSNPQSTTGITSTVSSSNGSLTTTISDDEAATWSVSGTPSVDEGGAAAFTFALDGLPQTGEQISTVVRLNDVSTSSADYESLAAAVQSAVTARPDLSFDAATGRLTFTGTGSVMADLTVNLQVTDDSLTEGPEVFSVDLALPSSATGSSVLLDATNSSAAVTVNDTIGNGGAAESASWSVSAPTVVDEGDTLTFSVNLSGVLQSGEDAMVNLRFADIDTNAADRADFDTQVQAAITAYTGPGALSYNAATSTLTFISNGNAMEPLLITLPITDDAMLEGPEDLSVILSGASGTTESSIVVDSGNAGVTTTINDTQGVGGAADGPAEWSLVGAPTVDEGGTVNYTLSLSETLQTGENASVIITLSDVTTDIFDHGNLAAALQAAAAARPDLAFNPSNAELTFTGTGGTMADLSFDLMATDDSAVEGAEDFRVSLASAASTTGVAVGLAAGANAVDTTINDTQGVGGAADRADWSIIGDGAVDEGGAANFIISLDALLQAGETSTVEVHTADVETNSSDYGNPAAAIQAAVAARPDLAFDMATGTLTFTSTGSLMADLNVSLNVVDDTLAEGPERYQILLSNPGSFSDAAISIDPSTSNLTTTIRDTVGVGGVLEEVVWSLGSDQTVVEGADSTYILSLSGTMAAGESVSVDINLTNIDTSSGDYQDFNAAITAAVSTYNAGADPGSLTWDGTTITFISDGTGAMTDVTVSLGTLDDVIIEGVEDIRLSLTNSNSATGVRVSIDSTADDGVTTIDDTVGPNADEATWNASGAEFVDEGGILQYTLNLSETLQAGENAFVQLGLGDITSNNSDYDSFVTAVLNAVASRTDLSFDAATGLLSYTADGSPMTDLLIDLAITDDSLLEGPEQFDLTLSSSGSGTGALVGINANTNNVTTTINDTAGDGGPPEAGGDWSITGNSSVNEGDTASYSVAVSGLLQAGEAVSVQLTLADIETDSADYASFVTAVQNGVAAYSGAGSVLFDGPTGVLTYVSDGTAPMSTLNFDIATNDEALVEGPERFRIDLSNPQSHTGLSPSISAGSDSITTNVNDDEAVTWSVSSTPIVDEGGTAQFTLALTGMAQSGEEASVILQQADIGTNSADYESLVNAVQTAVASRPDLVFDAATGRLTFTSSGSSMTDLVVNLQIIDDSLTEGWESFSVDLSRPSSGTGSLVLIDSANDSSTVAIADTVGDGGAAESVVWTIDGSTSVSEGGVASYTVQLGGTLQSGEDASVQLNRADVTTSAADLTAVSDAIQTAIVGRTDLAFDAATGTLTYRGDATPMTVFTFSLTASVDGQIEGPETFHVVAGNANSATGASVTIAGGTVVTTVVDVEPTTADILAPIASDDTAIVFENSSITSDLLNNDSDPDGDVFGIHTIPVSNVSNGSLAINADGTFSYSPNVGFTGTDRFTYRITDADGNSDTATVTVTVMADNNGADNNGPAAGADTASTSKNVPVSGAVLGNDIDVNGDILNVIAGNGTPVAAGVPAVFATAGGGSVTLRSDGTYDYTAADDFTGTDTFSYTVSDGAGGTSSASISLSVFDGSPVANNDINVTSVGTPVSGNVLTNDHSGSDQNDTLTVNIAAVIAPTNGTLVLNPDGSYVYEPDAGFTGSDSFTYEVCDEAGNCDTAEVTIEVRDLTNSPNTNPVATDDAPTTFENTPVSGSLLSNDNDPDGDPLTINTTPVTAPVNGSVVIGPDGTFLYTPDSGFTGTDSFVYEVCDDRGACDSATVTVTVRTDPTPGINDAPFAGDDAVFGTVAATVTGDLLANDSDPNNDPLTISTTPVSGPAHGTLMISSDGTFAYTPHSGFVGSDNFQYEVCDDAGGCSTATVTISIAADPRPNAPAVVNDENFTLFENSSVSGSLTANDGDPEGGPVFINPSPLSGPTSGSITINLDGTFTYSPHAGFTGTDTVQYEVCDADGNCDTGFVTFDVQVDSNGPANDAPSAADDAALTTMNEAVSGNVLANDSDPNGDALTVPAGAVVGPTNGTLVLNTDGTFTYTPDADFTGNDSFIYGVDDGNGGTATATMQLAVFAQRPTANPDLVTTAVGTIATGNVLSNDTDPDTGDTLTVRTTPSTPPMNGTLVLNADGTFTYAASAGFTGVDTFEYEVCDDAGVCDTGRVTIAIADISSALEVVDVLPNGEKFDVTMTVTVRNTGGTQLTDLNVIQNIDDQFGDRFVAVSNPVVKGTGITSGVLPNVNPLWMHDTTQSLLDPSGPHAVLNPNESFTLTFTVTVNPDAGGTASSVTSQATVSAIDYSTATALPTSDLSDSGSNPAGTNAMAPGDTGSADDVTHVLIGDAGLVNEVTDIERDGIHLILTMDFVLENTGTADLGNLVLIDELRNQLGENFDRIVDEPRITDSNATSEPRLNPAWDAQASQNIFDGSSGRLKPGESVTVQIRVKTRPGSSGVTELIHQGLGGGNALRPDGGLLTNPDGSAIDVIIDLSDSGTDPNGSNPGAPGDTGGTDDSTSTDVRFYTFDRFNEFSRGHGDTSPRIDGPVPMIEREILTKQINTLAPEPIFSGSARPGTRIVGRIFNSAGNLVGETMSFADTGGNWMMQFHDVNGLDFHRIEFVEVVGQSDPFGAHGDIYGYLGTDAHNNDYAAMEPITAFAERYSLGSVYRGSVAQSLQAAHRQNSNSLGFGV